MSDGHAQVGMELANFTSPTRDEITGDTCREGGHFTVRAEPDAETVSPTSERQEYTQLPQDTFRPTNGQRSAMQHVLDELSELKTIGAWSHRSTGGDRQAVAAEKEKEMVEELKPAVRDFFMQLMCHEFEGQPFS
ncbi:hypothetical protein E4U32_005876 [Claviceps aff. humidiphila group G2b]|nr:hypothetical protein E4U32_005876 [Claviceps aff. humidiphila group G2b]